MRASSPLPSFFIFLTILPHLSHLCHLSPFCHLSLSFSFCSPSSHRPVAHPRSPHPRRTPGGPSAHRRQPVHRFLEGRRPLRAGTTLIWIAIDDTDSRARGCTTWLVRRVLEALPDGRLAGAPRLVRLNPAVPWKTRGNGAVAFAITGMSDLDSVESRVARVVAAHADLKGEETRPGWVVTSKRPPSSFYERAVREVVPLEDAIQALTAVGARTGGLKGARGLIGCAGAHALRGPEAASRDGVQRDAGTVPRVGTSTTWECITYRPEHRWGTPRDVSAESISHLDEEYPGCFDSYDFELDEPVMVPSSPCPVLFGVRSTRSETAQAGVVGVKSEPFVESTLFVTNHASDDHLVPREAGRIEPRTSAVVRVTIAEEPRRRGGHVFVRAGDATGELDLAAFAPTHRFRDQLAALLPGDEVAAMGQVTAGHVINLEKFCLHRAAPRVHRLSKPSCPSCGRALKSSGTKGPFRCRRCATEAPRGFVVGPTPQTPAWMEVPASARRHLARPLKLGAPGQA
ncbi:MAG: TiaS agmantine-binding domain-containing protein [Thermoplasmatota archaeon]